MRLFAKLLTLPLLFLAGNNYADSQFNHCEPAKNTDRIVVAGGSITEILYFLDKPHNIVATDITSNYPKEARDFPSVGYVRDLSAEGLLSIKPTLILAEHDAGPPEVLSQLSRLNLDIRVIPEQYNATGIIDKVNCVAEIMGMSAEDTHLATAELNQIIQSLDKHTNNTALKVGVLLSTSGGLMIAGVETSGNGVLAMVGLENAFNEVNGWKPVTKESMLKVNPDVLLTTQRALDSVGGLKGLTQNAAIGLTQAGKTNQIYAFDGMALLGFGPRTLEAAYQLLEISEQVTTDH